MTDAIENPAAETPPGVCPRCGDANPPRALVCNACGTRLPQQKAAPLAAAPAVEISSEQAAADAQDEDDAAIAREIDARRAHHLLERACVLADRHDPDAAILSCRQALLLAPDMAEGHALLGHLLQQRGDAVGAKAAQQKAVQLAPESPLHGATFETLRAAIFAMHPDGELNGAPSVAKPVEPKAPLGVSAPPPSVAAPRPQNTAPVAVKPRSSRPTPLIYAAGGVLVLAALLWAFRSPTPKAPPRGAEASAPLTNTPGRPPASPQNGPDAPTQPGAMQPNSGQTPPPAPGAAPGAPPPRQHGSAPTYPPQPAAGARPAPASGAAPQPAGGLPATASGSSGTSSNPTLPPPANTAPSAPAPSGGSALPPPPGAGTAPAPSSGVSSVPPRNTTPRRPSSSPFAIPTGSTTVEGQPLRP